MNPPSFVRKFRDALLEANVQTIELDLTKPPVAGHRGILTTSHIQYINDPINLLRGAHLEYTFYLNEGQRLEISLQLYFNVRNHWRLFSYTQKGMLLSVNLTRLRKKGSVLSLSQKIKIANSGLSAVQRRKRTLQLCNALAKLGLEVDDNGRLILGTFDAKQGRFVDTTARAFVRDFVLASLLKGHFMGNKGYGLPWMPKVKERVEVLHSKAAGRRQIPLGLRYQVLEKANFRCKCGNTARNGVRLHVDHIVPFSQGGKTEFRNLQVLCEKCNLGKGNRSSRRLPR